VSADTEQISLRLSLQAFAWYADRRWAARPLFSPGELGQGHTGVGQNPAAAVDDLERQLQRSFEEIEPDDHDELLWLTYQPPALATSRQSLTVGYGKRTLECQLVVATFLVGAHRYAVVPRLGRWFQLADDKDWQVELQEQVDVHLRERRSADDEWEPPGEADLRRDRILPSRVSLRSDLAPFELEGAVTSTIRFALFGQDNARASATAELRKLAQDLTDRQDLPRAFVRNDIVDIVLETMATSAAPLALVGPPGSGKTSLVCEAIWQMRERAEVEARQRLLEALARRQTPRGASAYRRVYHLDPQRIVTGMSVVGQWQRRLELVLEWIRDRRRKTEDQSGGDVLFVDDPVALARVGRSRGSDMVASRVLRSWLEQGAFPMVIEATPEQWHRLTELDRPFAELFRVVRVEPPDTVRLLAMAAHHCARLEAALGVNFTPPAVERAMELHARYGSSRGLPGGLVDRLEEVARAPDVTGTVGAYNVDQVFRASSGLRERIADPTVELDDERLREELSRKLVGQPAAVDALAWAVHALKSGLRPRGRPVACWLFVGPTGVGKTEAAKVLVQTLFSSPSHLVRFDMNAFADPGALHRLIGESAQGEGLLTSAIRRRPFAVLLLDEIEKAHPSVHDLLLQLLDEGRLTDADGKTTSFESCVVVMTSNVGAAQTAQAIGLARGGESLEQSYRSSVMRAFRPEFVNRLDRIVAFGTLGRAELRVVADLQLQRLLSRDGFRHRTVLLDVPDEALDEVAQRAWDPRFGARGLKRAMERQLVAVAAAELASIGPEQPVRLTLAAGPDGTMSPRVEPLRWADPLPPTDPPAPLGPEARLARLAELEAQLEPMRPTGPISEETPQREQQAEVLAVLEAIRALREAMPEREEELPDSAARAIERASHFTTWTPIKGYDYYRTGVARVVTAPERLRAGLRALLVELARAPETERVSDQDLALVELRAQALREGSPGRALLRVRAATRQSPEAEYLESHLWSGWNEVQRVLEAQRQWMKDGSVLLQGTGIYDLLSLESGLHWWLPADDAPTVVQVQVDPLPEGEDAERYRPPWTRPTTILRLICPPSSRHDHGAVHDLRTGEILRVEGWMYALPRWLLSARRSP
jgi:ATP-dependent Clp protease ATP-binding subunit ClpC